MTIEQFVEKYCLHDSGLDEIIVDHEERTVRLLVDLCNRMQDDYVEGAPEIKPIEIVFSGVGKCENLERAIDKDFGDEFIALKMEADGTLRAELVTCKEQEYYEIRIRAEDVQVFER